MRIIKEAFIGMFKESLKSRFSLFDVGVGGLVVAATMHHDYWFAIGIFVCGSWLSGFLSATSNDT